MLSKKTVIGAFILLALIGGTFWHLHVQRIMNTEPTKVYKAPETPAATPTTGGHWHDGEWHAEPHTAPAEKPSPTEGLVKAELRQHPAEPQEQTGRPPMWLDKNGELPPEDTPRPFKHLTSLEGYDTDSLSDEDWLLFQNEFFFRMPKEWRDEHRKQRAESKKHAEFFEWYEEQFPREGAQ